MRCPDCEQGTIYQARCRKKNGECTTVYRCDINKTAWAEELCREKEILYDRFLELEEIEDVQWLGKADLPEISRADFYGWDETHPSALNCPYCRTEKLIHGISAHSKREIYECGRCHTAWIGGVTPEHISNYRKYDAEALRLPDETEFDRGGMKFLILDDAEKTDIVCPKCKNKKIIFGRIRTTQLFVYQCMDGWCRAVWKDSVTAENEIPDYRAYIAAAAADG